MRSANSKLQKICFILACLIYQTSCGITGANEKADSAAAVMANSAALLAYFEEVYPGKKTVMLLEGDCNADGITDLVIVYRENENSNRLATVYSHEGGFSLANPIPAPFEAVALKWKDIDERPPVELVVSGRRGIHFGIGVLRFVDGEWVDLFGGMENCC